MIKKLHVQGYKSLHDLEIDDLRRFVLISGDNSIGKTNLLEALFLFHHVQKPDFSNRHWHWRGIPHIPGDARHFYGALFHKFDTDGEIVLGTKDSAGHDVEVRIRTPIRPSASVAEIGDGSGPGLEAEASSSATGSPPGPLEVEIRSHDRSVEGALAFKQTKPGQWQAELDFDSQLPPVPNVIYLGTRLGMDAATEAARFGEYVERKKRVPFAVEIVKQVAGEIGDLSAIPFGGTNIVHCDVGWGEQIPLRLLGDGASRVLQYVCAILYAQGSVALFDEVDSGLHYSVKEKVLRSLAMAARERDCQIFATTHSYECAEKALEAFKDMRDDFCYVRLEREKGRIVAKHYSYDALAVAIENKWEVR